MKNEQEKNSDKPITRTSMVTEDALYEMVFDRINKKTSFFKVDVNGDIEPNIDEVELMGRGRPDLP